MIAMSVQRQQVKATSDCSQELLELQRRMKRPQRHRLLHGYPLAAAMPPTHPPVE